jgi:hypothetical protein
MYWKYTHEYGVGKYFFFKKKFKKTPFHAFGFGNGLNKY